MDATPAMHDSTEIPDWAPTAQSERCMSLDILRGQALFGVLIVNLLGDFRVSLTESIFRFHFSPSWENRATDVAVAALLEFKAFSLFAFLFGAGLAVFAGRAKARGVDSSRVLIRRLLVLLALGLCHLLVIWNGDILTLYAVCGLLMLPFIRGSAIFLVSVALIAFVIPFIIPWGIPLPTGDVLRNLAAESNEAYDFGGIADVIAFHWRETQLFILPLLVGVLPRTLGLMALGAAAWKAHLFSDPDSWRRLLWATVVVGGAVGNGQPG